MIVPECVHQVGGVDVVSDLLALVAKDRIRGSGDRTPDQVREKAVQLGARVGGAGEAASAEADRVHAEVASVLLHQNVGRHLARAEQAVRGAIERHALVDAVLGVRVRRLELPAGLLLDQRQRIGGVTVDLVGRREDEGGLGTELPRRLQKHQCALGVDAEIGEWLARRPVVARLCGGVDDQLDLASVSFEQPIDRQAITDVQRLVGIAGQVPRHLFGLACGRGGRAEEISAHVVVDADDVEPLLVQELARLAANQACGARDDCNTHAVRFPAETLRVNRDSAGRERGRLRGGDHASLGSGSGRRSLLRVKFSEKIRFVPSGRARRTQQPSAGRPPSSALRPPCGDAPASRALPAPVTRLPDCS